VEHVNVNFDQAQQIEGEFWIPEADQRFYGRIDHTPDATRMHLVNSSVIPGYGGRPISPTLVLFGETDAGVISVLDLHPITWTTRGDNANAIECLAETVVLGDHVEDLQGMAIRSISVGVHGLEETLGGAWPEPGLLSPGGGGSGTGEVFVVDLTEDVEVIFQLGQHTNISHGLASPVVYADARFVVPEGWTFGSAEERCLFPLRDLVQLSTRRVSYVNSVTIYRNADLNGALRILRAPYPRPDDRSSASVRALSLDLRRLGKPAEVISRWFKLSLEVGSVWPIFFSALRGTGLLEDRFLSLVAFAEGFHRALHDNPPLTKEAEREGKKLVSEALQDHPEIRRVFKEALGHANSQSLRERLQFFSAQATEAFGNAPGDDDFCAQVVHTRNRIVHWADPGRHVVAETGALVKLVRQLDLVLSIAVMKDAGLADDEVATAVASGWRFEGLP
jgi:hypothetical protein